MANKEKHIFDLDALHYMKGYFVMNPQILQENLISIFPQTIIRLILCSTRAYDRIPPNNTSIETCLTIII